MRLRRALPPATILVDHIALVVRVRAKKEMVRADASRVVAAMADQHSFGDCTMSQRPREPMRFVLDSLVTESSIASRQSSCLPFPATIAFRNLRPETFISGHLRSLYPGARTRIAAFLRAERSHAVIENGGVAHQTSGLDRGFPFEVQRANARPLMACVRTESPAALAEYRWLGFERAATHFACSGDSGTMSRHRRLSLRCHSGGAPTPPGFPIHKPKYTTAAVA